MSAMEAEEGGGGRPGRFSTGARASAASSGARGAPGMAREAWSGSSSDDESEGEGYSDDDSDDGAERDTEVSGVEESDAGEEGDASSDDSDSGSVSLGRRRGARRQQRKKKDDGPARRAAMGAFIETSIEQLSEEAAQLVGVPNTMQLKSLSNDNVGLRSLPSRPRNAPISHACWRRCPPRLKRSWRPGGRLRRGS
jgi:hypothetical protein